MDIFSGIVCSKSIYFTFFKLKLQNNQAWISKEPKYVLNNFSYILFFIDNPLHAFVLLVLPSIIYDTFIGKQNL